MKTITVKDKMQKSYHYVLTEPDGKNFDVEFKPELTPQQMLELGVFGGKYMTDCRNEFPAHWFTKAKMSKGNADQKYNYFRVLASLSLEEWRRKGWVYIEDPRGWFQWYCHYYLGRRIPDEDRRQIKRWKAFARHKAQIQKYCQKQDLGCRRKQRQALLQWAYDSRKI
jgi:hypothetical protein